VVATPSQGDCIVMSGILGRLNATFGSYRAYRALTHPYSRMALRATRTIGLAASIGIAGYGSGVHDALADPEGTTQRVLAKVLSSAGGGKVLAPTHADACLVTRLGNELIVAAQSALEAELEALNASKAAQPASDDSERERVEAQRRSLQRTWRFVVIDDDTINAFVTDQLPGYVFVHRGLIKLMGGDPEQLSFIIGHELAHHLCEHNGQTRNIAAGLSALQLLAIVAVDPTGVLALLLELGAMSTLVSYGITLPASRGHESEADALGLELVVRACRDPRKAIRAHETLAAYERSLGGLPDVTSIGATHPATLARLADLKARLPEAEKRYKQAGCSERKQQLWRAIGLRD